MAYMEFLKSARGKLVDDLLVLKAKGTVATSMVGEDPVGTDTYYDTGGGRTRGDVVINVYSMSYIYPSTKVAMRLQGSRNSSFTTGYDLQILELGASELLGGITSNLATADIGVGRYVLPFSNDLDGTVYRYLRHYINLAGTVGTANGGIQYEVYLSKITT